MSELDADGLTFRPEPSDRPRFFADESNGDRLLAMLTTLVGEVAVLRARLDTHERLAAAGGRFDRAAVEAYAPSGEIATERQADIQGIIERVFHTLEAEIGALVSDEHTQSALLGSIRPGTKEPRS